MAGEDRKKFMIYKQHYFGFVYQWTNKVNGKIYLGSHHGSIHDRYIGSGVYFKRAYKLSPLDFCRTILCFILEDDISITHQYEQLILDECGIIGDANLCYNLSSKVGGGYQLMYKTPEEVKAVYDKIRRTALAKTTSEKLIVVQRIRQDRIANPNKYTQAVAKQKDTKRRWSEADKRRIADKLRTTLSNNPDIIKNRIDKFKQTISQRTPEERAQLADKLRNRLSPEDNEARIEKQRNTISNRSWEQNQQIQEKQKQARARKSEQQKQAEITNRVEKFKNRTPEQKAESEAKRLASRQARAAEISTNIKAALQRKKDNSNTNITEEI